MKRDHWLLFEAVNKEESNRMKADIISSYLNKPYHLVFVKSCNMYTAKVTELQGCTSEGSSIQEAYNNLVSSMKSWIEDKLESSFKIPEPNM